MERIVYVDNASTTKVSQNVYNKMLPFVKDIYGNPSSIYKIGEKSKEDIEKARETIAKYIGANSNEIYFTSGGSEADNWAIKGIMYEMAKHGKNHIITSKIEHHAVLNTVKYLEKNGFLATYLDVDEDGFINIDELDKEIKEETGLVTIMYANNEIGTIEPVNEIGLICKKHGVLFHTDAVQAFGHLPIDVKKDNISMLAASAHKLNGPKGCGFLYIKRGIRLQNLIHGGGQEYAKRAGTENLPGIIGFAAASCEAYENMEDINAKLTKMRDKLIDELLKIEKSILNGSRDKRLPGNASFCFEGIEGESLLLSLDAKGILASSGSACTSGSLDPSHVLLAVGLPHEVAHGSLRISLGKENTEEEIDYIIKVLPPVIQKLRNMSPLWEKIKK
eukprot:TRINITY_DN2932_c0_g1_i4.p1 TRINITY_DN2932_c0_g1~~TRINITY_DN2932_c0_g1_i4.p1  ORF type:complete len:391 (+),score=-33.42 TRINITY_DN2932_c0_g1_i4:96-1268(+)